MGRGKRRTKKAITDMFYWKIYRWWLHFYRTSSRGSWDTYKYAPQYLCRGIVLYCLDWFTTSELLLFPALDLFLHIFSVTSHGGGLLPGATDSSYKEACWRHHKTTSVHRAGLPSGRVRHWPWNGKIITFYNYATIIISHKQGKGKRSVQENTRKCKTNSGNKI